MTTTIPTDGTHDPAPTRARSGRSRPTRALLGVGAALTAGLAAGLAARGLMRLAVLAVDGDPGFSVVGTAMIGVFFGVAVLPGTVARAMGARRTAVALLILGTGLVAFQSVVIGVQDLGQETLTGPTLAAVVAIAVGFAVVVAALGLLAWRGGAAAAGREAPARVAVGEPTPVEPGR